MNDDENGYDLTKILYSILSGEPEESHEELHSG
jgi:hypothetical protein